MTMDQKMQDLISKIEADLANLKAMAGGASVEQDEPEAEEEKPKMEMQEEKPNEADPNGGMGKKLKKIALMAAMKKGMA